MSELGDTFKEWREHKKKKKAQNLEWGPDILREHGISIKQLSSDGHFLVDNFDFWPSTGLFIHRKTKKRGRGVYNLIKILEAKND